MKRPGYTTADHRKAMRLRYKLMLEAADSHPYAKWVCIGDLRSCPACLGLSGQLFRVDDPGWEKYLPPIHKECRCRIAPVSRRDAGEKPIESVADAVESMLAGNL